MATPTKPRQPKTPQQRAKEQLALENRKVVRLDKTIDRLAAELATARADQADTVARRDHAAQHPDLQPAASSTNSTTKETDR